MLGKEEISHIDLFEYYIKSYIFAVNGNFAKDLCLDNMYWNLFVIVLYITIHIKNSIINGTCFAQSSNSNKGPIRFHKMDLDMPMSKSSPIRHLNLLSMQV